MTAEIRHAAERVPGVTVTDARARWVGHELHADIEIAIDDRMAVADANIISAAFKHELSEQLPALAVANVRFAVA